MKEFNLVIRPDEPMDQYTIVKVFRELGLSLVNLGPRQNEMIPLLATELKEFGGNFQISKDRGKALGRVIKYVNLGLEYASKKKGTEFDGIFDYEMAKEIVINKSLIDIYKAGKIYFEGDCQTNLKLLDEFEIKIKDHWFRLLSEADYEKIKSLVDIDYSKGMLKEHREATKIVVKFMKLKFAMPFFPINKYCFNAIEHFAGEKGGRYPMKTGLIEVMLSSLLIACLFRDKEQFFLRKEEREAVRAAHENLQARLKDGTLKRNPETAFYLTHSLSRYREEMKKEAYAKIGDKQFQWSFLLHEILEVTVEEVESFTDLLFFETDQFKKKVEDIKNIFFSYFDFVARTLIGERGSDIAKAADAFQFITDRIVKETKEFYLGLGELSTDTIKDQIREYWYNRVLLKNRSDVIKGAAISVIKNISPRELAQLSLDQINNAVLYFLFWPLDKQKEFISALNPNRFFNKEISMEKFLQFLSCIQKDKPDSEFKEIQTSAEIIPYQDEQEDWLKIVMNEVNWTNIHPYFVSDLWQKGTNQVRDLIFGHRDELKISLRSFKDYYLIENKDLRLFSFVFEKLVNQDIIRTKDAWEDIFRIAENMEEVKKILKLKRK